MKANLVTETDNFLGMGNFLLSGVTYNISLSRDRRAGGDQPVNDNAQ